MAIGEGQLWVKLAHVLGKDGSSDLKGRIGSQPEFKNCTIRREVEAASARVPHAVTTKKHFAPSDAGSLGNILEAEASNFNLISSGKAYSGMFSHSLFSIVTRLSTHPSS